MDSFSFIKFLNILADFFAQPTWSIIAQLFAIFGWIVFVWLLAYAIIAFYGGHIEETKNTKDW